MSDEIKNKNGKIDEMNRFISNIKQNNDLSAAFLIKSQEQMIITLTEQNNLLRKEIKENNYKYAQKTNELMSQIANLKGKKYQIVEDSNLSYHLIESFTLNSDKENSIITFPVKFVSEDEVNLHKFILSIYLKANNTTNVFDYLSKILFLMMILLISSIKQYQNIIGKHHKIIMI